ncbi:MAG: cell division control protein Cdc6, partial [Halobacteriales archaeon]|nr:cell division control protein Cdc6 [Halobacteriales archaeon]
MSDDRPTQRETGPDERSFGFSRRDTARNPGVDRAATRESEDGHIDVGEDSRPATSMDLDFDEVVLDDEPSGSLFDDLLAGEPIFENKEVLRPSYT